MECARVYGIPDRAVTHAPGKSFEIRHPEITLNNYTYDSLFLKVCA